MSTEVSVLDNGSFDAGIADVRSDSSSTDWALVGHSEGNPNEIYLVGSGEGGVEELVQNMDDSQMLYALVRIVEQFEMTSAIKFVYIRWSGIDVAFTKRGKYGVVHGSIEKHFDPYHISIETDNRDELTTEYIRTKIQETSGTKNKVLDATEAKSRPERGFTSGTTTKIDSTGTTPTQASHVTKIGKLGSSFSGVAKTAKQGSEVTITQEVSDAIKSVHQDGNDLIWCAVGYRDNNVRNPLVLLATGTGTDTGNGDTSPVDNLKSHFPDDSVAYGLFRVTDVVDDIPTVKFAFIQWVGENTKPMTKAKISTHKGALESAFYPTHVTIFATSAADVTQRIVMDKVMSASGSKSHIK